MLAGVERYATIDAAASLGGEMSTMFVCGAASTAMFSPTERATVMVPYTRVATINATAFWLNMENAQETATRMRYRWGG